MKNELVRMSISIPEDLLGELDAYTQRRGVLKNRSEAIRDLIRDALVKEQVEDPDALVFATVTMAFDHHVNDLRDKLDDIQHANNDIVLASLHIHINDTYCLETIVLKGPAALVKQLANSLLGTKGVFNGDIVVTVVPDGSSHPHGHVYPKTHKHDEL